MFKEFWFFAAIERASMLEESGPWSSVVDGDAFYRLVGSFPEGARA